MNEENKQKKEVKRTNPGEEFSNLPYWNTLHKNQAFPYVPQLKDKVVYFPAPHLEFIRRNGRKLKERIAIDDIILAKKYFFEGLIEKLEYIPDENSKCKIVLKLMIGRKSTTIEFHYFFGVNQPNFIVLKTVYESSSKTKFKLNETVKIRAPPFQDENGIIIDVKDGDGTDPMISYGVYKVLWYKSN